MPSARTSFANQRLLYYGIIALVFGGIAAWPALKPHWHAGTIEAIVQRGVAESQPLRERVAAFKAKHGRFPVTAAELGLPQGRVYTGTGIARVRLASEGDANVDAEIRQGGVIEVDFFRLPAHESIPQLAYTPVLAGSPPTLAGSSATWSCTATRLQQRFVPQGCSAVR